jgi:hypothetical protein
VYAPQSLCCIVDTLLVHPLINGEHRNIPIARITSIRAVCVWHGYSVLFQRGKLIAQNKRSMHTTATRGINTILGCFRSHE